MKSLLCAVLFLGASVLYAQPAAATDCDSLKSPRKQAACWKSQALTVPEPPAVSIPGPVGEKGAKGDRGDAGLSIVGATGAKGDAGARGETGATGATGPAGPAGPAGAAGADGRGFASGTLLLVRDDCPTGMTLVGTRNEWTLYNNTTVSRPWGAAGWSQLFVSLCQVN
jgi:hypothetical protein